MKKRRPFDSIFFKLVVVMLLISMLPLALLSYAGYRSIEATMRANLAHVLREASNRVATRVDGWIDTNLRVMREHAALDDMISMQEWRQRPLLDAVAATYEWSYRVYTMDLQGFKHAHTKTLEGEEEPIYSPNGNKAHFRGDRGYFTDILAGADLSHEVLFSRSFGEPAMILSVPIRSGETLVGVLAMATFLTDLSETVAQTRIGDTGFAFLVDAQGRVIAHGRPEVVKETLQDFSAHPAINWRQGSNELIVFNEEGREVVTTRQPVGLGWTLVVQQDVAEAFASLTAARRHALAVLVLTLSLALLAAFIVARRLAHPVQRLTEVADAYSKGELALKVPGIHRGDEIGGLARSIERLGISIGLAMHRLRAG